MARSRNLALEHAENHGQGPDWVSRLRGDGEIVTGANALKWPHGILGRFGVGGPPFCVLREHGMLCAPFSSVAKRTLACPPEGSLTPLSQMQVRGGLVLDMKSMNRVLAVTDDHIEVEAGAGWDVVLMAATERAGPPVVTDWLKVSWGYPLHGGIRIHVLLEGYADGS